MSAVLDSPTFELTTDQQDALELFQAFLMDPTETAFVLSGYSGCGKSTLIRVLMDRLPKFMKMAKLMNPASENLYPMLTATTNKAAENLRDITGNDVVTIHSALGLRVHKDYSTGKTSLKVSHQADRLYNTLLFIDEASYIDKELLGFIFSRTVHSKIVFIGDPAQLTPVASIGTPVFNAGFSGAHLARVVRQAEGNPIVDLATQFRHAVNTGEFLKFIPDGFHVQHLATADFKKAITEEFTRSDWRYKDSKILAWTNKCVVGYNQLVSDLVSGDPEFQPGDYAVCNSFVSLGRGSQIRTDEMVQITAIGPECEQYGVKGNDMVLNGYMNVFHASSFVERNKRIKQARAASEYSIANEIENQWPDLRHAYACTINKSQGSTFDKVFIDLKDLRGCNSGDQIARMLYVAVSRARHHVYLTGDFG